MIEVKKKRNLIIKLIIFLVLSSLIIFYFTKKDNDQPVDRSTPNDTTDQNPSDDNLPDVGESDNNTFLNKITYTESLDKDAEKAIVEYMNLYYKQMKELKKYDMTSLFCNDEQAYINETAIDLLIEIRKLKPNDLTLYSAKYDLDIKEGSTSGDTITVKVLENNYLKFNFMKDIESKVYNIENNFKLKKINGEYKILSYDKVQDFFVMVTDKYTSSSDYKTKLDKIKNDYLTLTKSKVSALKEDYQDFLSNGITSKSCDHEYNRDKALEYALKWVNKRNSDWSDFESNCQNFASQVVYAGGVSMDYTGSNNNYLQWKFYNATYNDNEVAKGYVYTWTSVTRFANYIKNNTGSGICATYGDNLYFAQAGDVIHVGTDGATRHALVVIGQYKTNDKVVDILVNSNTVDLENYPMSAYVYPYSSLIKIYGWND